MLCRAQEIQIYQRKEEKIRKIEMVHRELYAPNPSRSDETEEKMSTHIQHTSIIAVQA
jgi:hypothetical protein